MRFGPRRAGFSLIELIVVIAIIAILAAIAIPRLSRGAADAGPRGVEADLAVLQTQIELYAVEHGVYPAYASDGANGAHTAETFVAQLTKCSDRYGKVSPVNTGGFVYGPYLHKGLPALKHGPKAGQTGIKVLTGTDKPAYTPGADVGWVYNDVTGAIIANMPADGEAAEAEAVSGEAESVTIP